MNSHEKIQKLNTLAENIRVAVSGLAALFDSNPTMEHIVWRINKQISLLHQEVARTLEKEILDEDFKNIVRNIDKSIGDGNESRG